MFVTRNGRNSSLVIVDRDVSVDSLPSDSLALVDASFAATDTAFLHRVPTPEAPAALREDIGKEMLLAVE
jgi:hypothetical protein